MLLRPKMRYICIWCGQPSALLLYPFTQATTNMIHHLRPLLIAFVVLGCWCGATTTALAQQQMELLSQLYYPDGLSSIWGYTAPNGTEYALVGVKSGTSIVDVSNPSQPHEVQFVPGPFNNWRELKTWQHYAYITNELDEGVLIIDLQNLPTSVDTVHFTYNGGIKTAHTVWVDEFGYLYIMGYRNYAGSIPTDQRGVLMFDLNPNPLQPVFVGEYTGNYVHDAFVRNNLMYTAEIYAGQFAVVDVSDKQNPLVLATQTTTSAFTHNVWLSDNSQYAYVADEKNDAFLSAYDISDLSDIQRTDVYKAAIGTQAMPHNAHVYNDFVVLSYYTEGAKIIDAHQADALVETEFYDTSPASGSGSAGCWGVYPYFASGILLSSDRQEGMFITRPTYQRAAYLQGNITDAATGAGLQGVTVSIVGTIAQKESDFSGNYKMGTAAAATYSVTFSKYGYEPLTIDDVTLQTAQNTILDVQMQPATAFAYTLTLLNNATGQPVIGAAVELLNSWNNGGATGAYYATSNAAGQVSIGGLFTDTYQLTVHAWAYAPLLEQYISLNTATNTTQYMGNSFYEDDFYADLGWTVINTPNVGNGAWTRNAAPTATQWGDVICNPSQDSPADYGKWCYTTGQMNLSDPESNDLDAGTTQLVSPPMQRSLFSQQPFIHFDFWYCNSQPSLPTVQFFITDGNMSYQLPSSVAADSVNLGRWASISLAADLNQLSGDTWYFVVSASANAPNDLVEVGIDHFRLGAATGLPILTNNGNAPLYASNFPNPFSGTLRSHIRLWQADPRNTATLYDLLGRVVATHSLANKTIDTWDWGGELAAGCYILQIGNATDGFLTQKVVKIGQ